MTIHHEHPFEPPAEQRSSTRRLRGRLGGVVSLWTTGSGGSRAGLTVSSVAVADGDPGAVIGLLDPDSALCEALVDGRRGVVQLLGWQHRGLADAFAGVAPAPGGAFRLAEWEQTDWGPVLADTSGWAGIRLEDGEPRLVGWSALAVGVIEQVVLHPEPGDDQAGAGPLVHRRGRYQQP